MLDIKAPNGADYNRLNFIESAARYNNAPSTNNLKPPPLEEKQQGQPLKHRFYEVEYNNAFSYPELQWELGSRKPFDPMNTKYFNALEAGVKKITLASGETIDRASIRGMPVIKG